MPLFLKVGSLDKLLRFLGFNPNLYWNRQSVSNEDWETAGASTGQRDKLPYGAAQTCTHYLAGANLSRLQRPELGLHGPRFCIWHNCRIPAPTTSLGLPSSRKSSLCPYPAPFCPPPIFRSAQKSPHIGQTLSKWGWLICTCIGHSRADVAASIGLAPLALVHWCLMAFSRQCWANTVHMGFLDCAAQ